MQATASPDLSGALQNLCDILDAEAERQETLLEATRAQFAAAHARDVVMLEERTRAMRLLVEDTAAAEVQRIGATRAVASLLGLAEEGLTLSTLIAEAPAPYRGRLCEFQERMSATLAATKREVQENQAFLRRTAHAATRALESAAATVSARGAAYNHQGSDGPRESGPSLLDQQG